MDTSRTWLRTRRGWGGGKRLERGGIAENDENADDGDESDNGHKSDEIGSSDDGENGP